jgi:hypothetical protein
VLRKIKGRDAALRRPLRALDPKGKTLLKSHVRHADGAARRPYQLKARRRQLIESGRSETTIVSGGPVGKKQCLE